MSLRRNGIKTPAVDAQGLLEQLAHKCNDMKAGSAVLLITENDNRTDVIFRGPHREYRYTIGISEYFNPTDECCMRVIDSMLFSSVVNVPNTAVNS